MGFHWSIKINNRFRSDRLKNVATKSGCCNFKDVMASGFKVKAWNN